MYLILMGAIMLASWLVSSRLKSKFEEYSHIAFAKRNVRKRNRRENARRSRNS